MYTEEVFAQMPDSKPIDASNIDEICLRTLVLGMNPVTFLTSLIHPMTKSQVDRSFQRLLKLGLIQKTESGFSLTHIGQCVIKLPVEIPEAMAILFGLTFKCLDPILNIIFSGREFPFFDVTGKAKDNQMVRNTKMVSNVVNRKP